MNSIREKIEALKMESGSHSPSIETLLKNIPEINIKVDACFLSNPYATDLFMKYLHDDLITTGKLRNVLEYYPPQNYDIRKYLSKAINVNEANIFIGNGAIEIIQAVIHRFVKKKLCVILPTFSSYYEFVRNDTEVIYFNLRKENNFEINLEELFSFVNENNPDSIVIINPNNPNGGYLDLYDLNNIIKNLSHLDNIIIDESFIHFAYETNNFSQLTYDDLIIQNRNLIIIKSLSKDFGIAGIRAGYAIMEKEKVEALLKNGYLWNISGLADYFLKLYSNDNFRKEYEVVRKMYILNTISFLNDISKIKKIKVYPSKANFALVELLDNTTSFDSTIKLLVNNGVYVRDCSDKKGLFGEFVRIASRTFEENLIITESLKRIF
jgi:histidinol-phosphate/aromatic aminotransferase/cobyric acid decarboxylase-like protein